MLRKDAKMELLRHVTLFSGCSKRSSAQIALIADEIDFPAGKTLITQGDPGRQFFVVIEGEVKVTKNGKKLPSRGGSEFYGEISLVSGSPATATVTTHGADARARDRARSISAPLLDRSPSIQRRVLHSFSERLAPHLI